VAIPQRAAKVLERCTYAVTSPSGVTGALTLLLKYLLRTFLLDFNQTFRNEPWMNAYQSVSKITGWLL